MEKQPKFQFRSSKTVLQLTTVLRRSDPGCFQLEYKAAFNQQVNLEYADTVTRVPHNGLHFALDAQATEAKLNEKGF